jgi:hypothetical protein
MASISRFVKTRVFLALAFLNRHYCRSLVDAEVGRRTGRQVLVSRHNGLGFLNVAEARVLGPHDDLHLLGNPLPVLIESHVGLVPPYLS